MATEGDDYSEIRGFLQSMGWLHPKTIDLIINKCRNDVTYRQKLLDRLRKNAQGNAGGGKRRRKSKKSRKSKRKKSKKSRKRSKTRRRR